MNSKWFEEYERISVETRFLSKLGVFSISLFAFLNCWQIFTAVFYNYDALNDIWDNLIISVSFHLMIGTVFAVRFVLLFFNSKKSFWLEQLSWAIGMLFITTFFVATRLKLYGSLFEPSSPVFFTNTSPNLFLYASQGFELLVFTYFFLSLICQVATFVIAVKNSR